MTTEKNFSSYDPEEDPAARIERCFPSLTATEQEAARYILGHLTDVLLCNSTELSALSGVSQPTLSRLYRKLGYANAGAFRRSVRAIHRPGAPETEAQQDVPDDPISEHMRRDEASLERTIGNLAPATLTSLCSAMAAARRICIFGARNSYPIALHLREQLLQLREGVELLPHPGQSIAEEIVDLDEHDVAIIVAVRRRTALFLPLVDALNSRNVHLAIIGDVSARTQLLGRNVDVLEADLSSRMLTSYTSAFAIASLITDMFSDTLSHMQGHDPAGRIKAINTAFDQLGELEE
ncbi:MAG: MurR/RpiR family transcriptional regulator [Bifidobacterium sp.]|nr:MurR/RpiR family transcriptional regulator [Bifidobacterium sp.]